MPPRDGTATGAGDQHDRPPRRGRRDDRDDKRKQNRGENRTPQVVLKNLSVKGTVTSTTIYVEAWQGNRLKPGVRVKFPVGNKDRNNITDLMEGDAVLFRSTKLDGVVKITIDRTRMDPTLTHIRASTEDNLMTDSIPFPEEETASDYVVGAVNRIVISPESKSGRIIFENFEGTLMIRTLSEQGRPSAKEDFHISSTLPIFLYEQGDDLPQEMDARFIFKSNEHGSCLLRIHFLDTEFTLTITHPSTGQTVNITVAAF